MYIYIDVHTLICEATRAMTIVVERAQSAAAIFCDLPPEGFQFLLASFLSTYIDALGMFNKIVKNICARLLTPAGRLFRDFNKIIFSSVFEVHCARRGI